MSAETKKSGNTGKKIILSEILFGTLLALGAIGCFWISSSLLIHLYSNLY